MTICETLLYSVAMANGNARYLRGAGGGKKAKELTQDYLCL